MPEFIQKPLCVEARRYYDDDTIPQQIEAWSEGCITPGRCAVSGKRLPFLKVRTLHGELRAEPGDWIVKGSYCNFWPITDVELNRTCECVQPDKPPEIHLGPDNNRRLENIWMNRRAYAASTRRDIEFLVGLLREQDESITRLVEQRLLLHSFKNGVLAIIETMRKGIDALPDGSLTFPPENPAGMEAGPQ